jgi:hypothetical protein
MKTMKLTMLLVIMLAMSGGVVSACRIDHNRGDAKGDVIRQTRQVGPFSGIRVGGAFEVILKQGTSQEVIVETESDVIEHVTTKLSGNILEIGMDKTPPHWCPDIDVLRVYITCTGLSMLDLSGAVDLRTESKITTPKLEMDVSGAAEIRMDLAAESLDMSLSGASELSFTGTAGEVRLDASGAAEIAAYDMSATNFEMFGSGAVEARVNVTGTLKANLSGACSVKYKGNPRLDAHSSGASDIKRAD